MTSKEDKKIMLSIINESIKNGARKTKVCEIIGIPIRTVQRWEKQNDDKRIYRNIPAKNKITNEEREKIINICCSERFIDKSPKEIVPILAEEGVYIASESSMYRILREEKMTKHRENTRKPAKINKPKELKATGPCQVWSWDITYLKTCIKGIFYYLYLFMDIWSRKIVAWDIYEDQTGEKAKKIILNIDNDIDLENIHLHSDNGPPMKGATFLSTLQWLGIIPSFSRPNCSNDNPYSESLFKTIKYRISYPNLFNNIDEAKKWFKTFVDWYNNEHRHSGINYVTPNQRHTGEDKKILERRKQTYLEAMKKKPERWIKNKVRNWDWVDEEILNPNTTIKTKNKKRQVA